MRGDNHEIYATPDVEVSGDAHPFRLTGGYHRVEDGIGHILVESALVAEAPQILFDGLRFEALGIGAIFHLELREIGLPRQRAQRRKFVRREGDDIRVVRVGVGKYL